MGLNRRTFGKLMAATAVLPLTTIAASRAAYAGSGGTLVVSLLRDLPSLDPMKGLSANTWRMTANFYNNLTRREPGGEVKGEIAESWETNDLGTEWTFRLRPNVKFHDGSVLTSRDVVATFTKMTDPATAAPYVKDMGPIKEVVADGNLAVKFVLSSPSADLPAALSTATARIISVSGIENFDKIGHNTYGTGPFILKSFSPNDQLVMERNPDYFGEAPKLDRVIVRVLPDPTSQIAALQNREIDAIAEVEGDTFTRLQSVDGVKTLNVAGGTFNGLIMMSHKPPFNDPRVRTALKLAIDRATLSNVITEGTGAPAYDHPLSKNYIFHDPSLDLMEPDVQKARELLREAGYPDGFSMKVVVPTNPPSREKLAVVVQAMASQVGIQMELELMDNARFLESVWNKGDTSYIVNYTTRATEDLILSRMYHGSRGSNEARWATPETDQMLDEALATTDPAVRRDIYSKFQKIARDEGPYLIGAFFNALAAHNDYVQDFPLLETGLDMRFDKASLMDDAPQRT